MSNVPGIECPFSLDEKSLTSAFWRGVEALQALPINKAAPELCAALEEAIQAVRVFHGPVGWETYRDHSPEMKRWLAVLAKARGQS